MVMSPQAKASAVPQDSQAKFSKKIRLPQTGQEKARMAGPDWEAGTNGSAALSFRRFRLEPASARKTTFRPPNQPHSRGCDQKAGAPIMA
jgi:hypothetical protein